MTHFPRGRLRKTKSRPPLPRSTSRIAQLPHQCPCSFRQKRKGGINLKHPYFNGNQTESFHQGMFSFGMANRPRISPNKTFCDAAAKIVRCKFSLSLTAAECGIGRV